MFCRVILCIYVAETLRKHPPFARIGRECTNDYTIPGTTTVLEKGTLVWISIMGLHHDEKYYPHPEKFDPDRFLPSNKGERSPYVFLPFGSGPRNCIGAYMFTSVSFSSSLSSTATTVK